MVDYVRCPECKLVVPAFTGPEPLGAVVEGAMSRCGFCKWVFAPGPRMPLEVRRSCEDCGTAMRAPVGAAVLVCPACDGWFYNPEADATDRARAEEVLDEQHRIAAMVDRVLIAADGMIPAARQPERDREDVAAHGGQSTSGATAWTTAPPSAHAQPALAPPTRTSGPRARPQPADAGNHPDAPPPGPDRSDGYDRRPPAPRSGDNVRTLHPQRHPADPAGPMQPADPAQLADPAQPADGAWPADTDQPADSGQPADSARPATAQPADNEPPTAGARRAGHSRTVATPMTEAFAGALAQAVRDHLAPTQRRVLELRYGLDGRPGRTFREIGTALRRSPTRSRRILEQGVRTIAELARRAELSRSREHVYCSIAVHVAMHAIGDPLDPQTPSRIRAFIDLALPGARPDAATDLLLRLAGLRDGLAALGHDRALRRAVAAATNGSG